MVIKATWLLTLKITILYRPKYTTDFIEIPTQNLHQFNVPVYTNTSIKLTFKLPRVFEIMVAPYPPHH